MISTIIFWAFVTWAIIQVLYALFFFARLLKRKVVHTTVPAEEKKGVSIIICAQNEAANLSNNLPIVLSQTYHNEVGPMYEVIVVNDRSTDDTGAVLALLQMHYQHLKVVTITAGTERTLLGKKFALSKGVAAAANEWVLLTDADCKPASDQWLNSMTAPMVNGKEIVAGYGAYYTAPSFLNAFIRFETLHTFLQLSTYALAGKPYMAVGRNIGCTRNILLKAQQSTKWNLLPSGDDDMLINIAATAYNMAIVDAPAAFTYSVAKRTYASWTAQKQRHLSTGKYYPTSTKLLLALYGFTQAAIWLYFFALLFTDYRKMAICIMAARCALYWILWAATAVRLKEKNLICLLPLLDTGWMLYNFAFLPYILFKNKKHWK